MVPIRKTCGWFELSGGNGGPLPLSITQKKRLNLDFSHALLIISMASLSHFSPSGDTITFTYPP